MAGTTNHYLEERLAPTTAGMSPMAFPMEWPMDLTTLMVFPMEQRMERTNQMAPVREQGYLEQGETRPSS